LFVSRTFSRLVFYIENTGYQRGQGKSFDLQVKQPDGSWKIIRQGQVFGSIYAKAFLPVSEQVVRLKLDAQVVRQFDLF